VDFTVTVVTKNRSRNLKSCFDALSAQAFPGDRYEVIVADNGSTDDTRQVAEQAADTFSHFRYIFDARPGQLVGYHRALTSAIGDISCFIDDDVRPAPGWLSALSEVYGDPAVGLGTGPITLHLPEDAPDWLDHLVLGEPGGQTLPYLGMLDAGPKLREVPGNLVWGTNFSVRRSLALEVGGFHPTAMPAELLHFYGDAEVYLAQAVCDYGLKALYHPGASVQHVIPAERLTLSSVGRKFETTGYARSFQTLRQSGTAYPEPTDGEISDIAKRYFRDWDAAPDDLKQAVADGLAKGIRSHLKHFIDDPDFRRWVLRENYLDLDSCYDHPDLIAYQANAGGPETDWRQGN